MEKVTINFSNKDFEIILNLFLFQ